MAAEEPIEIKRRCTIDVDATLGGFANLLMRAPDSMPHEASVVAAIAYYACDHDDDDEEAHERPDHEPRELLSVTFEWSE
jgi:hypothetical protein